MPREAIGIAGSLSSYVEMGSIPIRGASWVRRDGNERVSKSR